MNIRVADLENAEKWDAYIEAHPKGCIYHHSLWGRVLSESFGYKPFYLIIENTRSDQISGILPAMIVNNPLTGSKVSVLPMSAYCPFLMKNEMIPDVLAFIRQNVRRFDYLEIKCFEQQNMNPPIFNEESWYVNHTIQLDLDEEMFYKDVFNKSIRRKLRKAEQAGFVFKIFNADEGLTDFYRLFISLKRRQGLPVLPFRFFENMVKLLSPRSMIQIPVIEYRDEIIAADILLNYKERLYSEYSASDDRFFQQGVNQKMLWELIRFGLENGKKMIDLGRSRITNTSLIQFKEKWHTRKDVLYYYYYPQKPKQSVRHCDELYKVVRWLHQKMPLKLLQMEGKYVYRFYG